MKEFVKFTYGFENDEGFEEKSVVVQRESEEGLNASNLCEAFLDFATSAGFSEQNVWNYFKE